MNSRWYVLQVYTGMELEIQKQLKSRGVISAVPIENRTIRRGSKWIEQEYLLFPGYVFVRIEYSYGLYYTLSGVRGVLKILPGGQSPIPLTTCEAKLIAKLTELMKEPSVIEFNADGEYRVIKGALKNLKIVKMHRRQRRAEAEITLMGKPHNITLSFTAKFTVSQSKQTQESKGVDSSA